MKSYTNLYEKYISRKNIEEAINDICRGNGKHREAIANYMENEHHSMDTLVDYMQEMASCENYKNRSYYTKEIIDNGSHKLRTITVPTLYDQIVHHMVIQVIKPIMMKGMYEHSYASIPGRGQIAGMRRMKKWISNGGSNIKYYLKIDIRKFFDSINHGYLIYRLRKYVHDERLMKILIEIISAREGIGIPIGFYTSQWFANWYLQDFDHFVKEELGVVYYMRYMDDMVIFHSNKRELHHILERIVYYLENALLITIKDNYQINRFHYMKNGKERGDYLDFMGFRFYRNRVTLRKRVFHKIIKRARFIGKKDKITIYDARQMVSLLGRMQHTNNYHTYQTMICPNVSKKELTRKISKYDKYMNSL